MRSTWRIQFYLLTALLLTTFHAFSYHIAGGDFTYRWVSGNTFELKLTLYRDCSNPAGSNFDQTIIVGVYSKSTNLLIDSVLMNLGDKDSLSLSGTGCTPPPQVCMQYGNYINTVVLPPNPAGYYVVWERCCRNSTITNLLNPDEAGMVFYAEIPDPALHSSSPVFNSFPLPYICEQQFFRFGFQATDIDGDSLVYSLINPRASAGVDVVFSPGYSATNPISSTPPMTLAATNSEVLRQRGATNKSSS